MCLAAKETRKQALRDLKQRKRKKQAEKKKKKKAREDEDSSEEEEEESSEEEQEPPNLAYDSPFIVLSEMEAEDVANQYKKEICSHAKFDRIVGEAQLNKDECDHLR